MKPQVFHSISENGCKLDDEECMANFEGINELFNLIEFLLFKLFPICIIQIIEFNSIKTNQFYSIFVRKRFLRSEYPIYM